MKKGIIAVLALLALTSAAAWAQKGPRPKSQKELEALQKMFNAADPDSRIKAAEDVLTNFADTDFKGVAMEFITFAYQEKQDYEKMIAWGEKTIEADPKDYRVMLLMAKAIAQRTKEFDLDKEEKLAKAEGYAARVKELVPTLEKPNPNITDEQWAAEKKNAEGEVHDALGLVAMARKKFDVAITEFKTALSTAASPDPGTRLRLGAAYNSSGKFDESIALMDQALGDPNLPPVYKQFAQSVKNEALKGKARAAGAPAPAVAPAPAPAKPAEEKKP